jgi:predicted RNA-binding Zn-ribbon protein involved in translation (DUF1610 family)
MKDKIRNAIKILSTLIGTPCPYCGGKWGAHRKVNSGLDCAAVPIEEAIKDLKSVLDNEQLPFSCPICGRYGCMHDHGY